MRKAMRCGGKILGCHQPKGMQCEGNVEEGLMGFFVLGSCIQWCMNPVQSWQSVPIHTSQKKRLSTRSSCFHYWVVGKKKFNPLEGLRKGIENKMRSRNLNCGLKFNELPHYCMRKYTRKEIVLEPTKTQGEIVHGSKNLNVIHFAE